MFRQQQDIVKNSKTTECSNDKYIELLHSKNFFLIVITSLLLCGTIAIYSVEKGTCFELNLFQIVIKIGNCNR